MWYVHVLASRAAGPCVAPGQYNRSPPSSRPTPVPKRSASKPHANHPDIDLDSLMGDIDVPELDADLAGFQAESGAVFGDAGVPVTFGNNSKALDALKNGMVVTDRSHWGRLRVSGPDRLSFLHGQSTADVTSLKPGSGCSTVLVDAQARTIDLLECLVQGSGVLLIVSPDMAKGVLERLQMYIFPGDKVEISDISSQTSMFSLLGPGSDRLMHELQAADLVEAELGTHKVLGFSGKPVVAVVGGGLPGSGYTFISDESVAADLWKALESKGALPMGTDAWEVARVQAGRPRPGHELTSEYNPLEAGLYAAVSLNKGCYIGQETLAKVHGQGALRRELWGLQLEAPCSVGDEIFSFGEWNAAGEHNKSIGTITSFVDTPWMQHCALAYLKCRFGGRRVALEGRQVTVGDVKGKIVRLPFATRMFPEGSAPQEGSAARRKAADEEAAAEAERREAKLRAMQDRLAAWQAEQK